MLEIVINKIDMLWLGFMFILKNITQKKIKFIIRRNHGLQMALLFYGAVFCCYKLTKEETKK